MPSLLPNIDPDGLLEYSVVFTDRSLNHMSQSFQQVMNNISTTLKIAYNAAAVVVVPGGGTFSMEAVARQFGNDKKCLVIRNGWFSYRWTQIFEMGHIPSESIILKARPIDDDPQPAFSPASIEEVVSTINTEKPDVEGYGFDQVCAEQQELGTRVRALLTNRGFKSVAAEGFQAPSVIVSHTNDADIHTGKKFLAAGLQIAAGVPLQCDEPDDFQTFRLGLFGLDKLHNIDRTVETLEQALDQIL